MLSKKCFFVGIVILLSVSLAIAAPPAVHPTTGEPLVIDCLRGTPDAIDGDLSDWNLEALTPAVLDVAQQLFSGQTAWTSPDDCSGQFYLMWDDTNIYVAVVVKDEKLSMNKTGGNIWNADCVEIFFSTTNAVAGHAEHYQYGFNANNQKWNWCNMDGAGNREPGYLQIASSPTAGGYICEAAIPYGQMPSLNFSIGNTIGFHPVFDDTDNGDRELQMTWTGREAHDQSLGFGHLVLSDEPAVSGPVPVDPGAEGLVAHYAFENDASDSSANGLHGTITGNPSFAAGRLGMALDFDGVGDFVDCGKSPLFDVTEQLTVAAWINIRAIAGDWRTIVAKGDNAWRMSSYQSTQRMHFAFENGSRGWQAANSNSEVPLNEWHHVCGTYDLVNGGRIYIDGALDGTNPDTGGITLDAYNVYIGENSQATGRFWDGLIDEVAIYNRALSAGEILHLAGHRTYAYDGDAAVAGAANANDSLDGTWDHNNGSDTWDGSGIGDGAPGGASALVEEGVTFLRIQDPGDPRDYGMPDPSNRKVYFTHTTDIGLDGVRLEVRARVATSAPLDDQYPDGGAGIKPWPAEGIGYHIRDNGKGMFGIAQDGLGVISFSLAQPGEAGFENAATDVLVMNNLFGAEPSPNVDTGEAATAVNMMAVDDATQWNTFVIDIVAGGTGTHVVSVSANGKPAQSFDVTVGTGLEAGKGSYITVGSSGTGGITAFDVDYISVSRPIPAPVPAEPEIVNLLANGGFEDGVLEPWNTYGAATAEVVRQVVGAVVPEGPIEGSHCLHVVVPAAGANFWDAGLQHAGHVFEANKEYTLSVWLKCKEGTLRINLKPELAASPWTGFGEQVVTITDQWAQYTIKTPVFGQDVSPGSITFHIAFAAGEFWVDGAQWYESAYFPPVEPPPGGVVNELTNGNFEEGPSMPLDTWAPGTWNVYGTHTIEVVSTLTGAAVPQAPVEGTYCLHVVVPQAGANFWDVGLQHIGHTFKQGKKYTLSAWFKSKSGTLNVNMKPELGADPWTGFGEKQITITDQWAEYSTTTSFFASDVTPGTLTFHIAFAAGDFWVDNVRWYEGDYVAP